MSDTYDVYGARLELSAAASLIAETLGIALEARSSDYLGDYYGTPFPNDTIEVVANFADDVEDLPYEEYRQYSVIVEVSELANPDEIRAALERVGFKHLEREVIDTDAN
jgi:hypothetical protein